MTSGSTSLTSVTSALCPHLFAGKCVPAALSLSSGSKVHLATAISSGSTGPRRDEELTGSERTDLKPNV